MICFAKRILKIFFKDKSAVFFSLMAVFIIIGLYALFLGDTLAQNFKDLENARSLMDSWIMAGLVAVTSVTTTMGAFGIMIDDRVKNISKDIYSSPISKGNIAGGYILGAFIIGVIMSIVAFILAEIYIVSGGGKLLDLPTVIKVLGLILLSTLSNTAMIFFVVSFFKSRSAFSTASTIIGTLIGFITGIYMPVGSLPESVQLFVKLFPVSHSAVLFRQVMMEKPMETAFANSPSEYLTEFKETMGVVFKFNNNSISPVISIVIVAATALIFYALAVVSISKKKR